MYMCIWKEGAKPFLTELKQSQFFFSTCNLDFLLGLHLPPTIFNIASNANERKH